MKYGNILILGASSGIGLAASAHFAKQSKQLFTASRRPCPFGTWIKADLSQVEEIEAMCREIGETPLDALLYLGGTWEDKAFSSDYVFEECADEDLERVLNVNLLAPIRTIQKLLPNLKKASNPRIIIMGAALQSLDQIPYKEVANTASKYGLRGMVAALRQSLKPYQIGISLINPGYVATPEVLHDLQKSNLSEQYAIPLEDIFSIMETILNLSGRTNLNEVDLPNMTPM